MLLLLSIAAAAVEAVILTVFFLNTTQQKNQDTSQVKIPSENKNDASDTKRRNVKVSSLGPFYTPKQPTQPTSNVSFISPHSTNTITNIKKR